MVIATVSDDSAVTMQLAVWVKQYCSLYEISPALMQFESVDALLEAGKAHHPDVIFVCQSGPEGFLRARRIAESSAGSRLVMVSDTSAYAVQCMRLHFTDYMVRPMTFKSFVRAMKLAGVG